ncbi:Na(+)/H(+)-K(+) antiporter GerN [Sideroxyarcus emersonii]|uniref:Na(+)/H(+)-K(+) antiporter GerN n=2 Tax=Sideroxyarcus emersonii TaxID=2764705 RepID=A0AAN1X9H2_9PROT|nr:Na(+)/H(+)-K(+) antiporter GerN [Sideroxyarcus emersonii]
MELHQFFLFLAIILVAARLLSETAARLGVPSVIGELVAGLLIGPSLLGWVSPDTIMKLLAEIGIILLLFEVGMDTDLSRLARSGSKPVVVALVGFSLPFVLGYGISTWVFGLPELTALFMGGTLTATSIGITVRVLDDLGKRQTDEAQIVIGAAVLDDILGVLVLAILYQFAVEQQVSVKAVGEVGLYILLFMVLAPLVAKLASILIEHFDQHAATPGLLLTMALSLILLFSWLAHAVGAPEIMGGFAAGLAFSQHFGFRLWMGKGAALVFKPSPKLAHRLEEQMRPLIHTFSPMFFVMVGVSLNLKAVNWSSSFIWELAALLLLVAFLGKLAAGFCIRESRHNQMAIGLSMIPRGEVGLIFAQLGFSQGILNGELYAALLIVIALTTMSPPFLLKWFYGWSRME